jgi:hypothetical protein
VTGQAHHDLRQYSFTAYGPPPPLEFSVLAGEVVHHLRSSLDHLVYQLVLANGQQPTERHEFPICASAQKFAEAISRGKIRGVSAAVQQRIETLQPHRCSPPHDSWLWVVHELDRIDKHRLLVVVLAVVRWLGGRIGVGSDSGPLEIVGMSPPNRVVPSDMGSEVFRMFFGQQYQKDVRVEPEFQWDVVLDQVGPVTHPPLIPVLRESLHSIQAVIRSFEAEVSAAGEQLP